MEGQARRRLSGRAQTLGWLPFPLATEGVSAPLSVQNLHSLLGAMRPEHSPVRSVSLVLALGKDNMTPPSTVRV
ncbi:hypothetical protein BJX61DRAFT_516385 [Aspergillus egyptiacus]|nr:hypothetical protein BJX61DRAFT_516385 [Aspergillus egyptiacus]